METACRQCIDVFPHPLSLVVVSRHERLSLADQYQLYNFNQLIRRQSLEYLFQCLWDTYEDIRQYALEIIIRLDVSCSSVDMRPIE